MIWWSSSHIYRRKLALAASYVHIEEGYPATAILPSTMISNGKVRGDFEDIEVIYLKQVENVPDEYIRLPREITQLEDGSIQVIFPTQSRIELLTNVDELYRVYYGDLDLLAGLAVRDVFDPPLDHWPTKVDHNDGPITYTRPGEHWQEGISSTRGARATFMGYTSQLRLISVTGTDKGVLEVQIDGSDWQLIDLFSDIEEEKVIFEAVDLDPITIHEVRMRVSGERNPKSSSDQVNIARVEYAKPVIVEDVGEEANDIGWSSATGGG